MCLLAQINPLKATHHDDDEIRAAQLHHAHQVCGIVAHTKDHGVASVAIRSLAISGSVLHEPREQHEVLAILTRIYHHTGWNLSRVHLELKRAWGWEPPALPAPTPAESQGGTLGAAAVVSQLFGARGGGTETTTAPARLRANFTAGAPVLPMPRHTSVATVGSASNHTSPAATAHTPASVSSTTNNAPTPPSGGGSGGGSGSRPTVNPLLAQADFNQPNHPYREWYKPPERTTGGGSGSFKAGGLWPY